MASHRQDRQALAASGQRSKSAKGGKRPLEAYDDQSDARPWREGDDTLSGDTAFSNLLTSSHASGSTKLVSAGQSHPDDVIPAIKTIVRDSTEPATHEPQGERCPLTANQKQTVHSLYQGKTGGVMMTIDHHRPMAMIP